MKSHLIVTVAASLVTLFGLQQSQASTLPVYADKGTVNSASYQFTVKTTGTVTAYFAGEMAKLTDTLTVFDNGVSVLSNIFNNQTTAPGTSASFNAKAGDILSFLLVRTDGVTFSSNPASNSDSIQHVYAADLTTASNDAFGFPLPAGSYTYVGFEDRKIPSEFSNGIRFSSDKDYNDSQFLFSNTTISSVPLPAGLPLFATALIALGGVGYRKRRHSASAA